MAEPLFGPKGWTPDRMRSLAGQIIAITGATSGTGFEATRILLSKGASVVMLNRSAEKSRQVTRAMQDEFGAQVDLRFVQMDLSDLASVRAAATEVAQMCPRIDALICNAAIAQVPSQIMTKDGFESQLGTNHYGHFVLCGMLFDRVDAAAGRIVVVSSLGYKMGLKTIQFDDMNWDQNYHQNRTYCHSKLAQMMFAYHLQDRISDGKVRVYVCHPGASRTSLISTNANFVSRLMFGLMSRLPIVQSAEHGAYPALMCATEDGLDQRAFYGPTGRLEMVGPVGRGTLEPYAVDTDVMRRLWEVSEEMTGYRWAA